MIQKKSLCKVSHRRGAVFFETAMVIPIFVLLTLGMVEFGRVIMVQQVVTNAAREGARRAIVPGADDDDVINLVDDYLVRSSLGASGRSIQIVDGNGNASSLSSINSHQVVGVVVTVPHDQVSFGLSNWFGGKTLGAVAQMRRE